MVNSQLVKILTLLYHKVWFEDNFFYVIYINDLSRGLRSNINLFIDDTSFFSITHVVDALSVTLATDLVKIQDIAFN